MKSIPFVIKPNNTGQALIRMRPENKEFSETWLQEMLQNHANILPVDEFEPVFWPIVPIGREIPTPVGFIDNLFISRAGYPIIVETKLWRNPEAKREVIAQAIDYASELSKWSFHQLDQETRRSAQKGVIDLIQTTFDLDPDEVPAEDSIAKNLRLGRFLILVVSDHIRNSLIEMLKYVNRFPHLATNVGLVELQCYRMPGQADILVVPSVYARTEIVERSIVQVNLVPNIEHHLSIEQMHSEPDDQSRSRPISEDAYWEAMQNLAPACVGPAKMIFDHLKAYPGILLIKRRAAISARMLVPDADQRLSLFFISTNGILECWPATLIAQVETAGLDRAYAEAYVRKLQPILRRSSRTMSISYPVDQIDVPAFLAVVDEFARTVINDDSPGDE